MTDARTNEQQGRGFAFYNWHIQKYGCDEWLFPHPAGEQTLCRLDFGKLNPLPALSQSHD